MVPDVAGTEEAKTIDRGIRIVEAAEPEPMAFDGAQITHPENRSQPAPGLPAPSLCKSNANQVGVAVHAPGPAQSWAIRRFTVTEVERLQGFPDGFTLIPFGNRHTLEPDFADYTRRTLARLERTVTDEELAMLAADGPRLRTLGNSMAIPVMRAIGEAIDRVERGRFR
jgi:site-specific DNA-cytosine methylase